MVTILRVDDAPTFDLVVRRSFADYLREWLQDGAMEYILARRP
jgi:sarcosine oxidase gamma subunit